MCMLVTLVTTAIVAMGASSSQVDTVLSMHCGQVQPGCLVMHGVLSSAYRWAQSHFRGEGSGA